MTSLHPPNRLEGVLLLLPSYRGATWSQSQRWPPPSRSQDTSGAGQVPPLFQRKELGSEKFLQLPQVTQQGGHQTNTAFDKETEAQREVNGSVTA